MNQDFDLPLQELINSLGKSGKRLVDLESCEGSAGNLSIFFRSAATIKDLFPEEQAMILPTPAPALAGGACLVTGSGQRLRDIDEDPFGTLGVIAIGPDGKSGVFHTTNQCRFRRVTSEFNSHLAVHQARIAKTGAAFHAIVHVQPRKLTFLSHIPDYQDEKFFNSHLLRWQPEMILHFPQGIGVLPFLPPASQPMMEASTAALEYRPLVVWSRHGVLARSDESIEKAVDLIEYLETAACYEYMNLTTGERSSGLSPAEMRVICEMYGVQTDLV